MSATFDSSARRLHCDDCGELTGPETARVWADQLVICDLHGEGRLASLHAEVAAMVDELRGLNDPEAECYACTGTGRIEAFKHVAEGLCFTCNGEGRIPAAALPEDMARCMGCDKALASGLIWSAWKAEVCPDCWEHVHGWPRWEDPADYGYYKHTVCDAVTKLDTAKQRNAARECGLCWEMAGKQGEDW